MNELSYFDIIKGKGLKQLRNENNLIIQNEYINSTKKIITTFLILGIIIGFLSAISL